MLRGRTVVYSERKEVYIALFGVAGWFVLFFNLIKRSDSIIYHITKKQNNIYANKRVIKALRLLIREFSLQVEIYYMICYVYLYTLVLKLACLYSCVNMISMFYNERNNCDNTRCHPKRFHMNWRPNYFQMTLVLFICFCVNTPYQFHVSEQNMFYFCWQLWWKMGIKGHAVCIIRCNKKKYFLKDCSPRWSSYFLCMKFCLLNIKISKGHIGSLGERCSISDLLFLGKGWLYSSCHILIRK